MAEHPRRHPRIRVGPSAGAADRRKRCPTSSRVPTTAGTGSEVGRSSVISDDVTHVKRDHLLARAAREGRVRRSRADARPAAGDHRRDRHGRADAQRRVVPVAGVPSAVRRHRARRRAHRRAALPIAVRNGRDLKARGDMLMSSMMGAIAFQKDLGAVHSCAHALSTVADLHHGLANGIMIDHVMRFNLRGGDREVRRARARRPRAGRRHRQRGGARPCIRRLARAAEARARHPGEAVGLRGGATRDRRPTFRASWKSRRPTSATRPIRGRARRTISGAFSRRRCRGRQSWLHHCSSASRRASTTRRTIRSVSAAIFTARRCSTSSSRSPTG